MNHPNRGIPGALAMALCTLGLFAGFAAEATAAPRTAEKKAEWAARGAESFDSFCATCHGTDAQGYGPLARLLTVDPGDLTRIATRRDGEFPSDAIQRRIDGSETIRGHGSSDMPSWGKILTIVEDPDDPDEKERVQRQIREIVEYLESIQDHSAE